MSKVARYETPISARSSQLHPERAVARLRSGARGSGVLRAVVAWLTLRPVTGRRIGPCRGRVRDDDSSHEKATKIENRLGGKKVTIGRTRCKAYRGH